MLNPPGRDASGGAEKGMTAAWLIIWDSPEEIGPSLLTMKKSFGCYKSWLYMKLTVAEERVVLVSRKIWVEKCGSLAYGKIIWVFKF